MKIKTIAISSLALLLVAIPVVGTVTSTSSVQAASQKSSAKTLTVDSSKKSIEVYDINGKSSSMKVKSASLKYYGTKVINGEYTYKLAGGKYLPTSEVTSLNGKEILYIANNSALYQKSGKKIANKSLKRSQIVNYRGQIKPASASAYRFFVDSTGSKKVLTYTTIKGKQYYQVGKNQYIPVSKISYINSYALLAKYQTVTLGKHNGSDNVPVYSAEGKVTKETLKAGSKVVVDRTKTVKVNGKTLILYGIKDKSGYVEMTDIAKLPNLAVITEK